MLSSDSKRLCFVKTLSMKNITIEKLKLWCKNNLHIDPKFDIWLSPEEISDLKIIMPEYQKSPTLNKTKIDIVFPDTRASEKEIQNLLGFLNLRNANALLVLPKVNKYSHIFNLKPKIVFDLNFLYFTNLPLKIPNFKICVFPYRYPLKRQGVEK